MSKWIYTDDRGCIMGINMNDMTGNTGWQQEDGVSLTVNDPLNDEHGAALYKLVDGKAVERSQEERESDWPDDSPVDPPPTVEELQGRVDMLTDCILEMSEIIYG